MRRVKVGVIGLGEIAQIVHLPVLTKLESHFEITAMCDISQQLLKKMGEKYNVESLYTNYQELLEKAEVDAVIVLTNYHTDCVVAALKKDKYVLVEKPMCLTISDADKIISANENSKAEAMVGYMRVFAAAFNMAVEEVGGLQKINYVKVRDIIGPNSYFIRQSSNVYKYDDIPQQASEERAKRDRETCEEVFGTPDVKSHISKAYKMLNGLSSHDISALRELIGIPEKVVAAVAWNDGTYIDALFKYDGFYASYEMGIVKKHGKFDASIEVYADGKTIGIYYDTPYISQLPVKLVISETNNDQYEERIIRPTFKDPFQSEMEHFYEVVTQGVKPKTTPLDAKEDLLIFKEMIKSIQENDLEK